MLATLHLDPVKPSGALLERPYRCLTRGIRVAVLVAPFGAGNSKS